MQLLKTYPVLRIYGLAMLVTLVGFTMVGLNLGGAALVTTMVLSILEISLSFDNAVVNAKVLKKMSRNWQRAFLTVGIFIAVFVVRVLLPVLLVSVFAKLSIGHVTDLALHHPAKYGHLLHDIHPQIAAFGGSFLLMLFLDYIFQTRKIYWLEPIETVLARIGSHVKGLSLLISAAALVAATIPADLDARTGMLVSGVVGIVLYAALSWFNESFEKRNMATDAAKHGLMAFLYLEVLDASFSLDGVLGAFAITSDLPVIVIGLGIGALWVRSMTVHLVHSNTLGRFRYLEHGAHYAIGVLAVLLLISASYALSEVVTGLVGMFIIVAALLDSIQANRDKNIFGRHKS